MKQPIPQVFVALIALLLVVFSNGCQSSRATPDLAHKVYDEMPELSALSLDPGAKLRVVATTNIVADVVRQVGGAQIELAALLPPGADPHAFEPTPQDIAAVADAHVIFVNGAGLEVFLEGLLQSTGKEATIVPVSSGLELLQFTGAPDHPEEPEESASDGDQEGGVDPHTWFDPHNVIVWTHNIASTLSALDPAHADSYEANAGAYETQLRELDAWIAQELAQIPQTDRKLVTDHTTFGYFARRYGFEQIGAVFPGYSTLDAPSAKERAALEDAIQKLNVKAIFGSTTVNPDLAEQVAEDTGAKFVYLYTGSLSEPGGPADSYVALMRYNVSAIVEALSPP